ncbi:hypothetical protein FHS95_002964 [Sphingomonas naasensis]|uniref:Uncharacterized protein n=1 Tax=Sphingomonas naasensis TaxID=1344951 RepID=A0A4S1W7J8_9SPHN|nr:hypothetical protein [Sphingomonas naasensis]NIJ21261.1 hypothetical protein [Sphingomonas naasensis]TGX38699.1 hypothetical protein E5A74_17855 [Sphingomonas naasensis]
MLKAGVFDNFKGATTLLLWGGAEDMVSLLRGLDGLRAGNSIAFAIDGPTGGVAITRGEGSTLTSDGGVLRWQCSRETIDLAVGLTAPLIGQVGHHFLDVSGMAKQVIIARDEYPPDLR